MGLANARLQLLYHIFPPTHHCIKKVFVQPTVVENHSKVSLYSLGVREWAPSWTDASLAAMSLHLKSEKNLALLQILIESVNPSIIKVMLNQANHLSGNLSKITNEETINNTTQRLGFFGMFYYLWPITFNYPGILWNIYNTHVCLYNQLYGGLF